MISYGFSVQGKSHIERGTVCQDYNKIEKLIKEWYIGVVADGVGSALHSEIGSRIATEALYAFCKENIDLEMSDEQLEDMLRHGYRYAMEQVLEYANFQNDAIESYDTTLSAVLYNGEKVIYGHAGDGGIIARLNDGRFRPITERQKGADGSSVRPLRAGEMSWDFGIYKEKVAAVLLATDGMLDGVFQPVLVNLPSDLTALAQGNFAKDNVYVTAAEFFMNPNGVYGNKKSAAGDKIIEKFIQGNLEGEDQEIFLKYLLQAYVKLLGKTKAVETGRPISKYYYAVWALKNVTDDKSVVCLMNEKVKVTPQDRKYYQEPNWKWRQDSYNALLYGQPMPPVPADDPMYQGEKEAGQQIPSSDGSKRNIIDGGREVQPTKPPISYQRKGNVKKSAKGKLILLASMIAMVSFALGIVVMWIVFGSVGDDNRDDNKYTKEREETLVQTEKTTEQERKIERLSNKMVNCFTDIDFSDMRKEDLADLKEIINEDLEFSLDDYIQKEKSENVTGSAITGPAISITKRLKTIEDEIEEIKDIADWQEKVEEKIESKFEEIEENEPQRWKWVIANIVYLLKEDNDKEDNSEGDDGREMEKSTEHNLINGQKNFGIVDNKSKE